MGKKINDFWVDDRDWEDLRKRTNGRSRAVNERPAGRPNPLPSPGSHKGQKSDATKEKTKKVKVSLDLSFPKLDADIFRAIPKKVGRIGDYLRSNAKITAIASVVVVIGIFGLWRSGDRSTESTSGQATDVLPAQSQATVLERPDFEVLLPYGKTEEDLIKSETRLTPSELVIFSYSDMLSGVPIEVTQQEAPENFRQNQDAQLKELADSFQLNNVISLDGISIYHGISEKQGVQSLATIMAGRMIFVRSPQALSDDIWAGYFLSLQ